MPVEPNISNPKTKEVIGAFVAPANTPIRPSAAKNEGEILSRLDKVLPKVEPITKRGVTSPP